MYTIVTSTFSQLLDV